MSFISTPFNSRVPLALRVAYPWMTNQAFTDFWANKYVPASTQSVNYVAARIAAGHTPTIEQVAALELFIRESVAAGDDTIAKRTFILGDTLAAAAINIWDATARLVWVGVPTVAAGCVTLNGTSQYAYTTENCTSFMSNDSAHLYAQTHNAIPASKSLSLIYESTTSCLGVGTAGGAGQMSEYGLNVARIVTGYYEGGHANSSAGGHMINQRAAGTRFTRTRSGGSIQLGSSAAAGVGTPPTCAHILGGGANNNITRTASFAGAVSGWSLGEGFPSDARADAFALRYYKLLAAFGAPQIP